MDSLRIFVMALMVVMFSFVPSANAETKIVEAKGEYWMGDGDSMENLATYKEFAYKDALRDAARRVSFYIETSSEVQNYKLTTDQIQVVSAKVMKVLEEDFRFDTSDDGKSLRIIYWVKVEVDPSNIDLKSLLDDRQKFNQNVYLENQVKAQQDEIRYLKDELNKSNADKAAIQSQIEVAQKKFLIKAYEQNLYKTDDKSLIQHYISEIRKLDPTNAVAQRVLAITSDEQTAINDALNILKIDPENIVACATLAERDYQRDHYVRIGIKSVRKHFTPDEIKKMTLNVWADLRLIYPDNSEIGYSVFKLYEYRYSVCVATLSAGIDTETYTVKPLDPKDVKDFIDKWEQKLKINFSAGFPSDFDINKVSDIIIIFPADPSIFDISDIPDVEDILKMKSKEAMR